MGFWIVGVFGLCFAWVLYLGLRRYGEALKAADTPSDWSSAAVVVYLLPYGVAFVGLTSALIFLQGPIEATLAGEATYENLMGARVGETSLRSLLGDGVWYGPPLVAAALVTLAPKIKAVRAWDDALLDWLLDASHLEEDTATMAGLLMRRGFVPSEAEREHNRQQLRDHDVWLSDHGDEAAALNGLEVVTLWRKTNCLLRLIHEWRAETPQILGKAELEDIRLIRDSDRRKLRHAFNLLRLLRQREAGGPLDAAAAAEVDPEGPADLPALRGGLDYEPAALARDLRKIEHYFTREYRDFMRTLSRIAARLVLHAGEAAPERWRALAEAGFQDMRRLERFTSDSVVKIFLLALGLCVTVLLAAMVHDPAAAAPMRGVLVMAGCLAFAALIGAMMGSNRQLARRVQTPWRHAFGAALLTAGCFLCLAFTSAITIALDPNRPQVTGFTAAPDAAVPAAKAATLATLRPFRITAAPEVQTAHVFEKISGFGSIGLAPPPVTPATLRAPQFGVMPHPDGGGEQLPVGFLDLLPWLIVISTLGGAIFVLTRSRWLESRPRWLRRLGDGLCLGAVAAGLVAASVLLHLQLDTIMALRVRHALGTQDPTGPAILLSAMGLIGFLVGWLVIDESRRVAQARM